MHRPRAAHAPPARCPYTARALPNHPRGGCAVSSRCTHCLHTAPSWTISTVCPPPMYLSFELVNHRLLRLLAPSLECCVISGIFHRSIHDRSSKLPPSTPNTQQTLPLFAPIALAEASLPRHPPTDPPLPTSTPTSPTRSQPHQLPTLDPTHSPRASSGPRSNRDRPRPHSPTST